MPAFEIPKEKKERVMRNDSVSLSHLVLLGVLMTHPRVGNMLCPISSRGCVILVNRRHSTLGKHEIVELERTVEGSLCRKKDKGDGPDSEILTDETYQAEASTRPTATSESKGEDEEREDEGEMMMMVEKEGGSFMIYMLGPRVRPLSRSYCGV